MVEGNSPAWRYMLSMCDKLAGMTEAQLDSVMKRHTAMQHKDVKAAEIEAMKEISAT